MPLPRKNVTIADFFAPWQAFSTNICRYFTKKNISHWFNWKHKASPPLRIFVLLLQQRNRKRFYHFRAWSALIYLYKRQTQPRKPDWSHLYLYVYIYNNHSSFFFYNITPFQVNSMLQTMIFLPIPQHHCPGVTLKRFFSLLPRLPLDEHGLDCI